MRSSIIDKIDRGGVFAIIPARAGSKGVPGKNIMALGGYPLVAFSIAAAKLTPGIKRVIVTTDSEEYAEVARRYGAETPFLRPKELAGDSSVDFEFIAHAIDWLYDNGCDVPEYWLHLRPTCPLRDPADIQKAIERIKSDSTADSLRSAHETRYKPYKWFTKEGGYFLPVMRDMTLDESNNPRQDFPIVYEPDGYADILKTEFIVNNDMIHGNRALAFESPQSVDIDLKEDYEKLASLVKGGDFPVYRYLRSNYADCSENNVPKIICGENWKSRFCGPKKILMVGLGSVGQRHLRNIRLLFGDQAEIMAYRKRGLTTTFSDDMKIRDNVVLEDEYGVNSFRSLDEALAEKPDMAFITNITSEHISAAIACAEAGCDLFIEKPLSSGIDGVDVLERIAEDKKLAIFMGFQNRYHPCVKKAKELLAGKTLGSVVYMNAETGERLASMHSYEDYRETYMARNEYGGGVTLNQMIHELDYIGYILEGAELKDIYASGGRLSGLEMDVEDVAQAVMSYRYGGREILVSVHADFLRFPSKRIFEIVCDNGCIKADILKNEISWSVGDENFAETFESFHRNDMFIEEIRDFFEAVQLRNVPKINLEDGRRSLEQALRIKSFIKI
ncbi:MAG: Gfo/Idh/MocA family oxidoreductase [Clostridiales bacterium]|jgi:CMP-N-acetylneuraminic acid synthetase/predicted dehydrogenase|nr:Gfo/Idh/MocA family oxidoreductase [Clostridiales bacterium]